MSCAAFGHQTASLAERAGDWHHLAVTWTSANAGLTVIYVDGLESESLSLTMASRESHSVTRWPGG